MNTRPTLLCLALASVFAAPPLLAQVTPPPSTASTPAQRETITIIGEGDRLGAGQMIQEEQPKARSTATRASLDKQRTTSNPYQGLALLPGVNTSSHDATGLFGGSMRVRGFNSDQMGFTVDGSPVNDSGSFSIFPQEYTDQENMCELFVTQGTPDTDAPHVGASGGNIGIVTCDPLNTRNIRFQQTIGELNLSKTFVRIDSGKIDVANGWRSFLSYSHAEVDKWRGLGKADRDHIDFRTVLTLPRASRLMLTALWNEAVNNNYRFGTKAQFAANPNFDFDDYCSNTGNVQPCFIGNPTPVAGTAQSPATQGTLYKLALNPFRNAIITGKANINVTDRLKVDFEPYFWYGYGTGGTQQFTINEGGTFRGGVNDVNGDGDRLDRVIIYRSSLTNTHRPGATLKASYAWENHRFTGGYWYERARHRQTGPGTRIDNAGNAVDLWLSPESLVLRGDGSAFQQRDQLTISRGGSAFISDTMGFFNEKLRVDVGLKRSYVDRDFTNYANEGTGQGVDYKARKKFEETLPTIGARWQFTTADQVFFNVGKNYKAPGNFSWQGAIVNGVNRVDAINARLVAETAVSTDFGYRHYGKVITFSGSVFNSQFKDRLARRFVPEEGITIDTNVGDGRIRGVEAEIGTVPLFGGFTFYLSGSYTRSRNDDNLVVSTTNTQPTAGKDFPDTPRWLSGFSVQYAQPNWYANVQVKYTGKRFTTLTNDDAVPGYTVVDINAGYRFGDAGMLRNLTVRGNVSNVFDKNYLALSAGSGSLFTTNATGVGASTPTMLRGAPTFSSVSISAEF